MLGRVPVPIDQHFPGFVSLFLSADKYCEDAVKKHCKEILVNNLEAWFAVDLEEYCPSVKVYLHFAEIIYRIEHPNLG